jgi:hypothetical protein
LGITAGAVGLTYLTIRQTGAVALGHAVPAGTPFQAAVVITGMSCSLGWFACRLAWAATTISILLWPAWQDIALGAGVTLGFGLVGVLRKCIRPAPIHGSGLDG